MLQGLHLVPDTYIAPCLSLIPENFKIRVASIASQVWDLKKSSQGLKSDDGQGGILIKVVNVPVTLIL